MIYNSPLQRIQNAIDDLQNACYMTEFDGTDENRAALESARQALLYIIAPFVEPAASPALPQPPPQPGDGRILDLVIDDLTTRADAGKLKYGVYLQAHNGRDALVDAYQEALDLAMYLRQKLEEQRTTQEPQPGAPTMGPNILLHSHTKANPAIFESVPFLSESSANFPDLLAEYAGRLCYRSVANMGHAPDFIAGRIAAGHEDIIEHAAITVSGVPFHIAEMWECQSPYLQLGQEVYYQGSNGPIPVSGNARAWLQLFTHYVKMRDVLPGDQKQATDQALAACVTAAPQIFTGVYQQIHPDHDWLDRSIQMTTRLIQLTTRLKPGAPFFLTPDHGWLNTSVPAVHDGPLTVTLFGANLHDFGFFHEEGNSATFLFEGISRSCTHQLVRHRLGSFSQESQRYVDLEKGSWAGIVPPAIEANPAALYAYAGAIEQATAAYRQLRALGVRKEDARFLLPNAMETRIVVTMNFPAWRHFFRLRALDKAAQWEIRRMAQHALRMLAAIAPAHFADQLTQLETLA